MWVARTSATVPSGPRAGHPPAPAALDDQVEGEPALEHGRRGLADGVDQGPLDLGAGRRPAGVDDPGHRVAALAGQQQPAALVGVEDGAEGDQLVDPGRALVDQDPHGVDVAQAGAGLEGVGQVEVGRVLVLGEHGGHPALGPAGGRLGQLGLGQHADPDAAQHRAGRGPDRGRQPGDAAAEDEEVELGRRRHRATVAG